MRRLVGGLVVVNLGLLGYLWFGPNARPSSGPAVPNGARAFDFIVTETGMNAEQRDRYAALRDEHQRAIRPLRVELRRRKEILFRGLQADAISDSLGGTNARAVGEIEAAIDSVTFTHFRKVRALLTPEQRHRFDAIIMEALRMMKPPPPEDRRDKGGPPPEG